MIYRGSETVELKAELVSDICKEIVAFANSRGGTLYVGIADDGAVVGVEAADAVLLRLNNMVRDSIKPDVTMFVRYQVLEAEGKKVIAATVQRGTDRPYYLAAKGLKPSGVYVRNGTSADPSTDTAIRKMIKETDGDSFEEMRSLEQELTFSAAEKIFRQREVAFDRPRMHTLGLRTADGIYSNLGLLLSDQCPGTIKTAAFSGTDQNVFQDRREFQGSLFQQMEEVYAYLDLRNQTKATFEGLYRIDSRDYPEVALREALMNCLVHRDYSYRASTLISVYDDRMEFVSIGGLPDGVGTDDIMLGFSICRNPKLAAVFYRLKLIEAYGTGMPKIMRAYQACERKPKIEVTGNAFKITLPNCNGYTAKSPVPNGQEQGVIEYLKTHGQITRKEVDALLDVSQATSNRLLKQMLAKGAIRQEGSGRRIRYFLKE